MAGRVGSIGEFNPDAGHSIKSYLERMEVYFVANEINNDKKATVFLSLLGEAMYDLCRSLCLPALSSYKSYADLAGLLTKHLEPEPLIIAERFCGVFRTISSWSQLSGNC